MTYKDYAFAFSINNKTESRLLGYRATYSDNKIKFNHFDFYFFTVAWWVE
jgi:hypothetical protein